MNEGFVLNVNAQDLINTADAFSNSGASVGNLTSEMMNLVTNLNGVWGGAAATAYISKFRMLDDDIERMISMIYEHVDDLETMAENYLNAETTSESMTDVLSTDVII